MRILIIDDSPPLARAIGRTLHDHTVVIETDPVAALARLRDGEWFDCILSDRQMPTMNGVAVLETVRAWFNGDAPSLILMSGAGDQLEAVADAVLAKPFTTLELHTVLEQLSRKRADQSFAATRPLPLVAA